MKKDSNYDRFPDNVFKPNKVGNKTIYLVRFNNLYDLYDYLHGNPDLNREIFRELSSINGSYDFAGKPYEEAIEDLIKENYNPGYKEFLRLQNSLENCINVPVHKYKTVMTLAGGHLNTPAYSAGNPFCYETEERIIKPKFVRINVLLDYYWATTKSQVFNRAIIITNILKALENAGYAIDLNTFSLTHIDNEYIHIVIKIKNYDEKLNMSSLYKCLCDVEFFRRIIFRVMETVDVRDYEWGGSYGRRCYESDIKRVLKFDNNDIFFDQPEGMDINGNSLARDFEKAINHLNLADKIDVERAKRNFSEEVKRLIKKK